MKDSRRWPYFGSDTHFVPKRGVEPSRGEDQVHKRKADASQKSEKNIPLPQPVAVKEFLIHNHLSNV